MEKSFTVALTGNPNSGKTTLFNLLTRKGEATGNRAGVTFEPKKARLKYGGYRADVCDLPGTYSLSRFGDERDAAAEYLESADADVIIDVCDATNLERGLFLLCQLAERFPKVVLALNMMDEARHEGTEIDTKALSRALGIDVAAISASKREGTDDLLRAAFSTKENGFGRKFKSDRERYEFCSALASSVTKRNRQRHSATDAIDRVICRKSVGIPLFFLIIAGTFALTFSAPVTMISDFLSRIAGTAATLVGEALSDAGINEVAAAIITGVLRGVGNVMSFLPQTAVLFFILELLEDVGYLSRAAFVTDGLLRFAGLSGKAFIPLLLGFGCTVPAVMSTATLDESERRTVIYSLPFIPCGARFPVIVMIASRFFSSHKALFAAGMYFFGIAAAIFGAMISTKIKPSREAAPLVTELPKFRLPQMRNLSRSMKNKVAAFMIRAGGTVMLASAAMSVLSSLDTSLSVTDSAARSLMAEAGRMIAPIFDPLGFGDWRICSALVAGVFAKETIVSSLSVLGADLAALLDLPSAMALAVFSMTYLPCAATMATVKKQEGTAVAIKVSLRCFLLGYAFSAAARAAVALLL